MIDFLVGWPDWIVAIVVPAIAVAVGLTIHALLARLVKRFIGRRDGALVPAIIRRGRAPLRLIFALGAVAVVRPALPINAELTELIEHLLSLVLIVTLGWLLVAVVQVIDDLAVSRYNVDIEDNLAARRIRTQINVLQRVAVVIIIMVTVAGMLMTFPEVRRIGQGLFASAGIAALIAGLAARPAFSNLIAGLQIALTEPIRLDDVVIVEGEYGKIEEITPTYVIVRIWDLRRLVVPLSYFIEEPFENWTRKTSDLLGTVFLYVDYNVPVDELRAELHHILQTSGLWDGKTWNLQVTNTTEQSVELRALMSATSSSRAWDLRCHVRERLVAYLQERYPESLPHTRAEVRELSARSGFASVAGD